MQVRRAAREGARRGEQERLPLHPRSRDRQAGPSDQGDAGADRRRRPGRAAVADAADSVHGQRQADGAGVSDRRRSTFPPSTLAKNKLVPIYSARCSRTRSARPALGRRELRSALLQPADRAALRRTPSTSRSTRGRGPKGYFSAYDPTTGELKWRQIFDGFGQAGSVVTAGGVVFVGTGSNIAGYFFAFDAQDRRAAVEVQHRRRRVLVAVDLHGERRAVRHGGVGRRRSRPARRRSDPELRAAAATVGAGGAPRARMAGRGAQG